MSEIGRKLLIIRKQRKLSLRQVERLTILIANRYGDKARRISASWLGRIERESHSIAHKDWNPWKRSTALHTMSCPRKPYQRMRRPALFIFISPMSRPLSSKDWPVMEGHCCHLRVGWLTFLQPPSCLRSRRWMDQSSGGSEALT